MTKPILLLLAMLSLGGLSACVADDEYPISGEECGPEDPVKDVSAADLNCVPGA